MSKKQTNQPAGGLRESWAPLLVLGLTLLIVAVVLLARGCDSGDSTKGQTVATGNFQPVATTPSVKIEDLQDSESGEHKGLRVTKVGSYTGIFMEDGTDEVLSRILMVIVENTGNKTVQYAEIELTDGEKTAYFKLSTLPPGEKVVLLEKNRMAYDDGKDLQETTIKSVAVFNQEPSLCEDKLKIQMLDGVMNVTNISGGDITGDIVIYYKNAASDLLYGGITYRVTITGGLKADEVRQLTASHFTSKGSRVMFVTVS